MGIKTPGLSELMQQLIALPSISCTHPALDQGNRHVIDTLAGWLDGLGFRTAMQSVSPDGAKANLIATAGTGSSGLVLAGHTDTVPFDESRWQHDPFKLTEADNRFYGLGTADMKAFFALVIEAIRDLDLASLKQPLIILATADEETSMSGARALNESHVSGARFALIGEPTSLIPVRMHKGIMMEAIRLTGMSGHSSDPALGNSALEAMHRVIGELQKWRSELQVAYNNPLFEVPVPTLNLGHIHGGDNPNRICGHCELQIDIRPLPGMQPAELRHELKQRLAQSLSGTGISYETTALMEGVSAMETPEDSTIVSIAEELTGTAAAAASYATEAPYLNAIGVETVVMGPGRIQQAHQPDEYIDAGMMNKYIKILRELIKRHCL